jgi:hypothetical protein
MVINSIRSQFSYITPKQTGSLPHPPFSILALIPTPAVTHPSLIVFARATLAAQRGSCGEGGGGRTPTLKVDEFQVWATPISIYRHIREASFRPANITKGTLAVAWLFGASLQCG